MLDKIFRRDATAAVNPPVNNNPHAFALGGAYPGDVAATHVAADVWRQFRACSHIADDCLLGQRAWCNGTPAQIRLGSRTICRGILLCDGGQGRIEIGDLVYIGDDVIVTTRERIRIGSRTLVSHGVQIFDNDSHPLDAKDRHEDYLNLLEGRPRTHLIPSAPVEIGDDCWIGANSIILKGVKIGNRAVVAAGSVVTADVDEDCVVAGNPARVVRSLI